MEKRFAIKNKKLLNTAKNIFGKEMIIDAWVIGYDKDNIREENSELILKETEIDIGCITIALKLSNGNIITATSSEWGDISKNNYDFVEVE